jgi:hypothetical protein
VEDSYSDEFVDIDSRGITIKWYTKSPPPRNKALLTVALACCRYYFPTTTAKLVPWEHVKGWELRRLDTLIPTVDYKSWGAAPHFPSGLSCTPPDLLVSCVVCRVSCVEGMGMSDVWWACDMKRYLGEREVLVLTTGSWIRKGFSCRDAHTALHLIALYAGRAAVPHSHNIGSLIPLPRSPGPPCRACCAGTCRGSAPGSAS